MIKAETTTVSLQLANIANLILHIYINNQLEKKSEHTSPVGK